jgi:hypothetical protein
MQVLIYRRLIVSGKEPASTGIGTISSSIEPGEGKFLRILFAYLLAGNQHNLSNVIEGLP